MRVSECVKGDFILFESCIHPVFHKGDCKEVLDVHPNFIVVRCEMLDNIPFVPEGYIGKVAISTSLDESVAVCIKESSDAQMKELLKGTKVKLTK